MKHIGWKIIFGISWIPAGFLYYLIIYSIVKATEGDVSALIGGVMAYLLLIPVILVAGLQVAIGYLSFRK